MAEKLPTSISATAAACSNASYPHRGKREDGQSSETERDKALEIFGQEPMI